MIKYSKLFKGTIKWLKKNKCLDFSIAGVLYGALVMNLLICNPCWMVQFSTINSFWAFMATENCSCCCCFC